MPSMTMAIISSLISLPLSLPPLGSPPHRSSKHNSLKLTSIHHETKVEQFSRRAARRNISDDSTEAAFLDENGVVVDDMDGYLNQLSLEYDSVWDTKPAWCQPWTIALTGVLAIASSWLVLHSVVVTTLVSSIMCAWWYIFLYSYPKAYSNMIAERRKNITDGVEDTFGLRNPQ